MFILLCGEAKAGKTTACWKALPGLRALGIKIAGFVAPALLDERGAKSGIQMVDLVSGERQILARVARPGEPTTVGDYKMVDGAADWARNVLAAALLANSDWLVVDEIGPLELHQGKGFAFALDPLADPLRVPNGVVLVRQVLVGELAERLGRPDMTRVEVTEANRANVPAQLIEMIRTA
jgi:nucleoside-triphosphatase THEP1